MVAGIDVSHYNGVIDWQKVAGSGVKFAYIKCTDGATFQDPMFVKNRVAARLAGLKVGSYHFLRPGVTAGQLNGFLSRICGATDDLPPCLDVELPGPLPVLECAQRIAQELKRVPLIYTNHEIGRNLPSGVDVYPLWIAAYKETDSDHELPNILPPWEDWAFWQYADKGSVAGIEGSVDLDWFNGDAAEFAHFVETSKALPT